MRLLVAALALLLALTPSASAHGLSGTNAEGAFQLPPWIVWSAGASVVALSFLLVAASVRRPAMHIGVPPPVEQAAPLVRSQPLRRVLTAAALAVLVVAVAPLVLVGFSRVPQVVLWWVGWGALPLVGYLFGDVWRSVNPFLPLARVADRVAPRLRYPAWVGAWPAVAVVLMMTGVEVWPPAQRSDVLAGLIGGYAAFTLVGMVLFGPRVWLAEAEAFSRLFRVFAAHAPVSRDAAGRFRFRSPWDGLRRLQVRGIDEVAFIVAILYGVNFDGFLATPAGKAVAAWLAAGLGAGGTHVALLLAGYLVFLAAFLGCARAMREKSRTLEPTTKVAARFAASLVPIAVAYHAAHNLPFLVENAPRVAHAMLDPFGQGWNEAWRTRLPIVFMLPALAAVSFDVLALLLIVGGHVIAVAAAHEIALDSFPSLKMAFRAEVPLTAAMVFYTLVGLWILGAGGAG